MEGLIGSEVGDDKKIKHDQLVRRLSFLSVFDDNTGTNMEVNGNARQYYVFLHHRTYHLYIDFAAAIRAAAAGTYVVEATYTPSNVSDKLFCDILLFHRILRYMVNRISWDILL